MNFSKISNFLYEKRNAIALLLLLIIVFFALWFRYRLLDIKDMWIDEYFTEDGAFYTLNSLWQKTHTRTTLLFSLIMKIYAFLLTLVNPKNYLLPFEVRLPNVLFGTLLIIQVYYIVRKISDIFTSLLASTICTVTPYLVYYSRDGRYYPLMLVCIAICLWGVVGILSKPFNDKKQLKYHLIYMLGGFCGMFAHYGFWIYFAISNIALCLILCYRFFVEASATPLKKKIGRASFQVLSMAIPAFTVPLIVYKRYGSGISAVFSEKMYDKSYLLNSLTYKSINYFYQEFFPDFKQYTCYILAAIIVMTFFLLIFFRHKKIIIYLATVQIGTFALLRFIPRNIIAEPLRARYIMYLAFITVIIFSLFIGLLFNIIKRIIARINSKASIFIYTILAITSLFFVSYIGTNFVLKSKLGIYARFDRPSKIISKVKEYYRESDVVLTDLMEPFFALPYYQKIDLSLNKIKCYYIGWCKNPPSNYKRIILITRKDVSKISNVSFLDKVESYYFNLFNISEDWYKEDIAFSLSKIIHSNDENCKNVLKEWELKETNILEYVNKNSQPINIIDNFNFTNNFIGWEVKEKGNANICIISSNDYNVAKISGAGGWTILSKKFDLKNNKTYRIIIYYKIISPHKDLTIAGCFKGPQENEQYITLNKIEGNEDWQRSSMLFHSESSGESSIRIQYLNTTDKGYILIKEIKVIELRDNIRPY